MNRRNMLNLLSLSAAAVCAIPLTAKAAENSAQALTVMEAIRNRHSVRAFKDATVSDEDIKILLQAAMQAPSAANEQPWEFVVVRDKETLKKVGAINKYAFYAQKAPLGILICLNKDKENKESLGMGILDVGMSAENLMLAAVSLGLGSTFTGIYPFEERIKGFQELFALPQQVIPIGFIVIGYPMTDKAPADRFNEAAIHQEKW